VHATAALETPVDDGTRRPSAPQDPPALLVTTAESGVELPAARTLTPVSPSTSVAAAAGEARSQAIASMVSAANHAVIQRVATGSVDVPELGRIAVRAATLGGGVDVDVVSDRPETRAILHASAGALAADLKHAEVPLRQLRFDANMTGSTTPDRSHGSQSDRGPQEHPRRPEPVEADAEEPSAIAPGTSVRIVL
jgi:hypothetical protein